MKTKMMTIDGTNGFPKYYVEVSDDLTGLKLAIPLCNVSKSLLA